MKSTQPGNSTDFDCQTCRLPEEWAWETLSSVVGREGLFVDGDWVESKDQDPNGDVRLIQLADIGDGYYRNRSDRYLTHEKALKLGCTFLRIGDLLVARMPDPLGRACIFPGDSKKSVTVVDVCVIRTGESSANHRWLLHAINLPNFRGEVESLQSGSTRKRISRKNLAKILLPVPPLPEQERIVARLEELLSDLEAGVATLARVRAGAKRYKASVLKAACEGRLFNVGAHGMRPSVQAGRTPSVPTGAGGLPEGWRRATVGEVADHRLGKMLDKQKNKGEMRPYLRNINVRWFDFDLSDIQYMRVMDSELESISVRKGDLIVCEGGEPGRAAVWNQDEPFIIQKALHRVRLNDVVLPIFLTYCLSIDAVMGKLERYFTGSTIKHFTGQSLHTYEFPLPTLEEQRRIVAEVERRLESMRAVESAAEAGLKRAGRLRQAVLRSAFEGRLG